MDGRELNMKLLSFIIGLCLAVCGFASGITGQMLAVVAKKKTVAMPLDSYTSDLSVACSATQRLLSSYTGPLIRVRRSSDDAEQDIGYASDGTRDDAAMATFVGANSAYIRTFYDQSGNARHFQQATAANQPRIVNAGTNETHGMFFDDAANSNMEIASAAYTDYAGGSDVQVAGVFRLNDGVNSRTFDFGADQIAAWITYGGAIYWDAPYPAGRINYSPAWGLGVTKTISLERASTTSSIRVNGSVEHSASVAGTISGTSAFRIGSSIGGSGAFDGWIQTFCIWTNANSAAGRAAAIAP